MYKCLECGHIFDEGEQIEWNEQHGLDAPPYEHFSGCPICSGAYEETKRCIECGGEFLVDELYEGYCIECLAKQVTYDSFFAYTTDGDTDNFMLFMFEDVYDSPMPGAYSNKLYNVFRELFLRAKANDLLCDKTELIDACRTFIIDEDGESGKQDFAEWLKERN
jgi:hypothetical protein